MALAGTFSLKKSAQSPLMRILTRCFLTSGFILFFPLQPGAVFGKAVGKESGAKEAVLQTKRAQHAMKRRGNIKLQKNAARRSTTKSAAPTHFWAGNEQNAKNLFLQTDRAIVRIPAVAAHQQTEETKRINLRRDGSETSRRPSTTAASAFVEKHEQRRQPSLEDAGDFLSGVGNRVQDVKEGYNTLKGHLDTVGNHLNTAKEHVQNATETVQHHYNAAKENFQNATETVQHHYNAAKKHFQNATETVQHPYNAAKDTVNVGLHHLNNAKNKLGALPSGDREYNVGQQFQRLGRHLRYRAGFHCGTDVITETLKVGFQRKDKLLVDFDNSPESPFRQLSEFVDDCSQPRHFEDGSEPTCNAKRWDQNFCPELQAACDVEEEAEEHQQAGAQQEQQIKKIMPNCQYLDDDDKALLLELMSGDEAGSGEELTVADLYAACEKKEKTPLTDFTLSNKEFHMCGRKMCETKIRCDTDDLQHFQNLWELILGMNMTDKPREFLSEATFKEHRGNNVNGEVRSPEQQKALTVTELENYCDSNSYLDVVDGEDGTHSFHDYSFLEENEKASSAVEVSGKDSGQQQQAGAQQEQQTKKIMPHCQYLDDDDRALLAELMSSDEAGSGEELTVADLYAACAKEASMRWALTSSDPRDESDFTLTDEEFYFCGRKLCETKIHCAKYPLFQNLWKLILGKNKMDPFKTNYVAETTFKQHLANKNAEHGAWANVKDEDLASYHANGGINSVWYRGKELYLRNNVTGFSPPQQKTKLTLTELEDYCETKDYADVVDGEFPMWAITRAWEEEQPSSSAVEVFGPFYPTEETMRKSKRAEKAATREHSTTATSSHEEVEEDARQAREEEKREAEERAKDAADTTASGQQGTAESYLQMFSKLFHRQNANGDDDDDDDDDDQDDADADDDVVDDDEDDGKEPVQPVHVADLVGFTDKSYGAAGFRENFFEEFNVTVRPDEPVPKDKALAVWTALEAGLEADGVDVPEEGQDGKDWPNNLYQVYLNYTSLVPASSDNDKTWRETVAKGKSAIKTMGKLVCAAGADEPEKLTEDMKLFCSSGSWRHPATTSAPVRDLRPVDGWELNEIQKNDNKEDQAGNDNQEDQTSHEMNKAEYVKNVEKGDVSFLGVQAKFGRDEDDDDDNADGDRNFNDDEGGEKRFVPAESRRPENSTSTTTTTTTSSTTITRHLWFQCTDQIRIYLDQGATSSTTTSTTTTSTTTEEKPVEEPEDD
ncbi:unnamed protein product [Amoebophrya sp. A120]|nr:unnamed protein product [Amoebophrya sp. A120]|eukprot:GSA120T00020723001.1